MVKKTGERQVKAASVAGLTAAIVVGAGTWKFQGKPSPVAIAVGAITAPIAAVTVSVMFLGGM